KKKRQLKTFPGLAASRFQHPQDQQATEALAGIPGLDLLVSKVMEYGLERLYYLENIADNVRVTPRMLPRLHRYPGWGCRIRNIATIISAIGQATLGIGSLLGQGLVFALHDWYRKAELTADRAGLLCVQNLDPCMTVFMKLAGGAGRLWAEMDHAEFIRQIQD